MLPGNETKAFKIMLELFGCKTSGASVNTSGLKKIVEGKDNNIKLDNSFTNWNTKQPFVYLIKQANEAQDARNEEAEKYNKTHPKHQKQAKTMEDLTREIITCLYKAMRTSRKNNFAKLLYQNRTKNLDQLQPYARLYLKITKNETQTEDDATITTNGENGKETTEKIEAQRKNYDNIQNKWEKGSACDRMKIIIAWWIAFGCDKNPQTKGIPAQNKPEAHAVPPPPATPAPPAPPPPAAPPAQKSNSQIGLMAAIRQGTKLRTAQPTKDTNQQPTLADALKAKVKNPGLKPIGTQQTTDWSTLVKFSGDTGITNAKTEKDLLNSLMNHDEQKAAAILEFRKRRFALMRITLEAKESVSLNAEQEKALKTANDLLNDIKSGKVKLQPSKAAAPIPKRPVTPPAKKNFVQASYIKDCIMAVLNETDMPPATKQPIDTRLSNLYVNGTNNVSLDTSIINGQLKKLITGTDMRGYWTKNIRPKVSSPKNTEDACKNKLKEKIKNDKPSYNPTAPQEPIQVLDRIENVLEVLFFGKGDLPASIDEIK